MRRVDLAQHRHLVETWDSDATRAVFVIGRVRGLRVKRSNPLRGTGRPQNVYGTRLRRRPSIKEHIAQKPLAVVQWMLQVVPSASLVLDPFMGSGTTLEAAKIAGHRAIGVDSDERYCEMAANRLAQGVFDFGALA